VGRMNMEKGVINVINVWKKVVEKIPEAKLALAGVIGEDFKKIITKLIKQYKLDANVDLFGSVTEEKKNQILSQSQIFLHLAKYEPLFPVIGILEGFSHGLPAIVYDMPVVSSQIKNLKLKNFMFIAKNGDREEVTGKILEYDLLSKNKKNDLSQKAKKFADLFDWDQIAKKEFIIINSFINNYGYRRI